MRADLYQRAAAAFRKFMMRAATQEVAEALAAHDRCGAVALRRACLHSVAAQLPSLTGGSASR